MISKINIKQADKSNIDFVVNYALSCMRNDNFHQHDSVKENYIKRLQANDYKCYIAFYEDKPAGYIDFEIKKYELKDTLWVNELFVSEEFRGQNIATKLKQHVEEVANNIGYDSIYTSTEPDNHESLNLLKKMGYTPERLIYRKILQ